MGFFLSVEKVDLTNSFVHKHVHVRPGTGRNASCTLGDSRPEGCSRPRELWFFIYSCMYMYMCNVMYGLVSMVAG